MPSPFPLGKDENYDDNIDIDRGIEDRLFPPMTITTPEDRLSDERFWELWEPKEPPTWFCRPEDI
jgi:hypothetical protein